MRRACIICAAAVLLMSTASCQDYVCEEGIVGIKGRLWFNPNPIRFPPIGMANEDIAVQVTLANIGSETVEIEAITLSGNSDFYLDPGITDLLDPTTDILEFPIGFGGTSEECERYTRAGAPIFCRQGAGYMAEGTFVIETNDPTSPTLEIPIVVDPDAMLPVDQSYPVGTIPIVKPNPIRFHKRMEVGESQTLEVCLRLDGAVQSSRITDLELRGENFSIQGVADSSGESIPLPLTGYAIGQDTLKILVVNEPVSDSRDGGTLSVVFVDDLGEERTLLVPILDSW